MSANNPDAPLWEGVKACIDFWTAYAEAWRAVFVSRAYPAMSAMLGRLSDSALWSSSLLPLAKELEQLLLPPGFADLPTPAPGLLPSVAPSAELIMAMQQYLVALAPVWVRMYYRFQAEIAERRRLGEELDGPGQVLDVWNTILDHTLMEFNRSAEFGAVQKRFLRAKAEQRLQIRKLSEAAAEALDLPTHTDFNDVCQRLHHLHLEVHSLRRELRAMRERETGGA